MLKLLERLGFVSTPFLYSRTTLAHRFGLVTLEITISDYPLSVNDESARYLDTPRLAWDASKAVLGVGFASPIFPGVWTLATHDHDEELCLH